VHGLRPTTAQSALQEEPWVASIHWVNCQVDPSASERTTGVIGVASSVRPGLSAAILGSFHVVI
jgi:hypothetical protein